MKRTSQRQSEIAEQGGAIARRVGSVAGSLAAGLMLVAGGAAAQEVLLDGIAAQVGSGVVLVSEVTELASPIEERMRNAGVSQQEIQAMRADALERLIEARLIETVVQRLELGATDREIDAAIGGIARDTGLSPEQLYASVRSHGLTIDEYREKIRGEIERTKVLNTMVRSKIKVSDAEIEALYKEKYANQRNGGEEIHLRHIVVSSGSDSLRSISSACEIVRDASVRIKSGEVGFDTMAKQVSDSNAQEGGDIGWVHTEDLAGWMLAAVSGLEAGQSSDVIEMPFGCNLLQVVARREFTMITYEMAKIELHNELWGKKSEQEYMNWLNRLRDSTYIERKGFFVAAPNLRTPGITSPGVAR